MQLAARSGSSRKSQSVRLEHDTLGSVATSCTYASAINASKISSVFVVYRHKTLTGSPDPTHVNGTDKLCKAKKAMDTFLSSIKSTLHKHIPAHAQGPLIANALSTAFQLQMSVWRMIWEECVCPVRAKHSDWCGLASIV